MHNKLHTVLLTYPQLPKADTLPQVHNTAATASQNQRTSQNRKLIIYTYIQQKIDINIINIILCLYIYLYINILFPPDSKKLEVAPYLHKYINRKTIKTHLSGLHKARYILSWLYEEPLFSLAHWVGYFFEYHSKNSP